MKIATQSLYLEKIFGDIKAIKMLCEIGFDSIDYSMFSGYMTDGPLQVNNYQKKMKQLREIADGYGVNITQAHAPFPSYVVGNEEYNKKIIPQLIRSIEASAILGVKQIIIHPIAVKNDQKQFNLDFYNSLLPYAKQYNVKIALENMFGSRHEETNKYTKNICSDTEQFVDYLDALDSDYFTACLDIGHCGLVGEDASNMIYGLGHDRLKALHVHDNDFINDLHTLPFTQKMNFPSIMKALKDIDYTGELTLESDRFLEKFPDELLKDATIFMYKTAKHLVDMYKQS
ncbi:MAG: sugar phosphate isomerase/epimerase [Clostridiales bacterium]|nr:sugar phosphate isomerase/epimerase [Clostridiales bacterium]